MKRNLDRQTSVSFRFVRFDALLSFLGAPKLVKSLVVFGNTHFAPVMPLNEVQISEGQDHRQIAATGCGTFFALGKTIPCSKAYSPARPTRQVTTFCRSVSPCPRF